MLKAPYIRYFGRVLADEHGETIRMDWSLCGFDTDRPREDGALSFCPDSDTALVPQGLPETRAQKWDFTQHPVDTVIINLGTNDADACNYYDDAGEKAKQFEKDYHSLSVIAKRTRKLQGCCPAENRLCDGLRFFPGCVFCD